MRGLAATWACLALAACGNDAPPPAAEPPEFAIHEWGVIAVPRNADSLVAMAMNGARTVFVTWGPRPGSVDPANPFDPLDPNIEFGIAPGTARGLKPVIYVHVAGGGEVELSVRVGAPAGMMMETLPPSTSGPVTEARWNHLRASGASCPSTVPAGPPPCGASDHYCEAIEDPFYDTDDASCLHLRGGGTRNHLFYRARVDAGPIPLAAFAAPEGALVIRNQGAGAVPGPAFRIYEADDRSVHIASFTPPPPGGTVTVPIPPLGDIPATRAAIIAAIRERGLTDAEARAFDRAWAHVLFGVPNDPALTALRPDDPPDELRASRDVILYPLPDEVTDRILPLGVAPRPAAVHRALFVRLDAFIEVFPPPPPRDPNPPSWGGPPSPEEIEAEIIANAATVTLGTTRIAPGGPLGRSEVRGALEAQREFYGRCFVGEYPPRAQADVPVTLTVEANGVVSLATVEREADRGVRECLERLLRNTGFPASTGVTTVNQTLRARRTLPR